jgi:ribosomal 50S subunit-recycling heat shock protein
LLSAVLAGAPIAAIAQQPVTKTEAVETTATIVAIDHTDRIVTLKNENGEVEIGVGPEIKRFDELKVGDKISFRYQESVLVQIKKAGEAKTPASDAPKITRGTGARPSGTIAQQQTATVTIKALDTKVPSVTVATADGHTFSSKVSGAKVLEGFKVGDKVDIVYTEALMISVK